MGKCGFIRQYIARAARSGIAQGIIITQPVGEKGKWFCVLQNQCSCVCVGACIAWQQTLIKSIQVAVGRIGDMLIT